VEAVPVEEAGQRLSEAWVEVEVVLSPEALVVEGVVPRCWAWAAAEALHSRALVGAVGSICSASEEVVECWTLMVAEELHLKVVVGWDEKPMAVVEEVQHAQEAEKEELELLQFSVVAAGVLMACLAREEVVAQAPYLEAAVVLH
jgi:hypothetical protein